ncbi:hypothetical protein DSO57_1031193 [Entomophthora muscae]|uniref:Uncharacterized protein n=1 Tax=Entomophthora muscae TaxID=34485 RepID=A0ACC2SPU6_9FUNG|nr:hypothetical protein DSO57_1031193 [Entomophthora muscae]
MSPSESSGAQLFWAKGLPGRGDWQPGTPLIAGFDTQFPWAKGPGNTRTTNNLAEFMSPLQLEGTPKNKWELQPEKPTQSVHQLCGPSPPGFGGVLPTHGPLFLMVWEIHPDPGPKVGHRTLQHQSHHKEDTPPPAHINEPLMPAAADPEAGQEAQEFTPKHPP